MTSLVEEAKWANLREALGEQFHNWNLPYADDKADRVVYNLRRSGWRIPLPPDSATPPRGRAARPDSVRKHIADCRNALRNNREDTA